MSEQLPLLIEIGCEELPLKALPELTQALFEGVLAGLDKRGIAFDRSGARSYFTPRRMCVQIDRVADTQPEQHSERRGPAVSASTDAQGQPAKALIGFAQSCGVAVEALETLTTDKGAWYVHRSVTPGARTADLLLELLREALKGLPVPKPMRWGERSEGFVRPVLWLVLLLGDQVVDGELFGIRSGRLSRGHRFHHPDTLSIASPASYVEALRGARVIVDPVERAAVIRAGVEAAANQVGGQAVMRDGLVAEVVALTEWPMPILCSFERDFLRVPAEALVMTMESNQKFFAIRDASGALSEHFVGFANIESRDPGEIRRGYERVIRPRFADARFFFDEDLKAPLASLQESLQSVTYQQALGSIWDKCVRVAELGRVLANRLGVDAASVTRAAGLSKCDLMTRMVGEFPELQGVMGRYYANAQGESREVADALDAFYQPRFAGDSIASGSVAQVLAIAERADTLAGIFAVGLKPSGNKDPFALRRAALGLGRTIIEGGLRFDLEVLLREAAEAVLPVVRNKPAYADTRTLTADLHQFVLERLRGYYVDQGIGQDLFDAVAGVAGKDLSDFDRRLRALPVFVAAPEAQALAAANKRIRNILRKTEEAVPSTVDAALMIEPAEGALLDALKAVEPLVRDALAQDDYGAALRALAGLHAPVDAFFDGVMVMCDDARLRGNRLALLKRVGDAFLGIADVSVLQIAG